MRKKIAGYLLAAAVFLLAALPAHAAGNTRIVELRQKEAQLLAWVRDAGSGDVTAMLGKTPVENVSAQAFAESGMELHTLILIDNSLSIPEGNRPTIRDRLLELVAARKENEYYAVGTIGDCVTILSDFTKDYMQLKSTLEALEYQYQDTFLTDALYDYLITSPFEESENSFSRILIISDGVDNKSLGYTKDELLAVLKDTPLPIYSIGIENWNEANDEELENMFALARAANGNSLLLSDLSENVSSLTAMMDADWDSLAVTVAIPEAIQDGSLQTLTLRFGEDGPAASLDNLRMPLTAERPPDQTEQPPAEEPEEEPEKEFPLAIVAAAAGAAVCILLLVIFLIFRTKRPSKTPPTPGTKPGDDEVKDPPPAPEARQTERVPVMPDSTPPGRQTRRVFGGSGNEKRLYIVTLRDTHNPDKFYQKTIEGSLIVGANPNSDICIDYDSTISRKQCEIILENGKLYLVNHSTTNITELNHAPINQKTPLTNGGTITMGLVEMIISFQPG